MHAPACGACSVKCRVLLIGARASGKSTVAAALGCPWADMDALASEALGGSSPSEAFAAHGEAAWRQAEAAVLGTLLEDANAPWLIAAGGGVGCMGLTCDMIDARRDSGDLLCIWLRLSPDVAVRRLGQGTDRPPLLGEDAVVDD